MKNKIDFFLSLPLSRKIQALNVFYRKRILYILFKKLFKRIGENCFIDKHLFISYEDIELENDVIINRDARLESIRTYGEDKFKPNLIFRSGSSIQQRAHITFAGEIEIGHNSIISYDVMITDIDHEYSDIEIPVGEQPLRIQKTNIGDRCFIGAGAKIQAGTILGNNCIVGTNSVVRGIFPDNCVIVGIPAKIVKKYNPDTKKWEKNYNGQDIKK